ncbi:hypothetical protein LLEC1_00915 [Akanthomyces lecanii]|uniref:Peptidase S1 domain-containing protein n=1 Tax=Cordyceps confragosa TaxID=2714763 RepID=A0A179IQ94_CORDF|nr:hypothetical protein LLEC1_00915 [Akanthomyces lecanii]
MIHVWGVSLLALAVRLSSANPLVIDQATFKSNGGDVNDVANSIRTHNRELREYSYNTAWLVVGDITGCTATWLGDKGNYSYVLTAAHCVDYEEEVTNIDRTFIAWDGRVIASGPGTAYVPPERVNRPPDMGGASTDVAIMKLPTRALMMDQTGRPLDRPILNDALSEKDIDTILVGYGTWGVGDNVNNAYGPATGIQRLYARSRITSTFERDYGIDAAFQPVGPSASWARVASGDSGSAWWQIRSYRAVIIATTNGGHSTRSTGARVAKYINWIRSRYPDARVLSEEKPQGCIVSLQTNDSYCLSAGERSPYSLPAWIYNHQVYVDAAPGTAVVLSDYDNLLHNRLATFVGTVENDKLKAVKAANGETIDFSYPKSMRVQSDTTAVGCIVSLTSVKKYCLPAGQRSGYSLPSWIYAQEVQVEAVPGAAVMLSDSDDLSYNRIATFNGLVQNWELKRVKAANGEELDFSRPKSMRVL